MWYTSPCWGSVANKHLPKDMGMADLYPGQATVPAALHCVPPASHRRPALTLLALCVQGHPGRGSDEELLVRVLQHTLKHPPAGQGMHWFVHRFVHWVTEWVMRWVVHRVMHWGQLWVVHDITHHEPNVLFPDMLKQATLHMWF